MINPSRTGLVDERGHSRIAFQLPAPSSRNSVGPFRRLLVQLPFKVSLYLKAGK
jgi:hypothetical protein